MAKFETLNEKGIYYSFASAIYGMRNPYNSHNKADSYWEDDIFVLGENDYSLAVKLCKAGSEHRKFMRMINLSVDMSAPRYWWEEFATYSVGTSANSESTMHTIMKQPLSLENFELPINFSSDKDTASTFNHYMNVLNTIILKYNETEGEWKERYFQEIKAMLPESFIQKRTVNLNYEVLHNMYKQRHNHRLPQWSEDFVSWINTLPYSEFITQKFE